MFNRQAADSDGGGGAAVRLSAPLSRALRVWVFFSLSLSLFLCRRRSRVAGFQRWQATFFFSDVIVVAPPSSDGQHHNSILLCLCFLFIFFLMQKSSNPARQIKIFSIFVLTRPSGKEPIGKRFHWKSSRPVQSPTVSQYAQCSLTSLLLSATKPGSTRDQEPLKNASERSF